MPTHHPIRSAKAKGRKPKPLGTSHNENLKSADDLIAGEVARYVDMQRQKADLLKEKLALSMGAHQSELVQAFMVDLSKVPQRVRRMTCKDFSAMYDCDIIQLLAQSFVGVGTTSADDDDKKRAPHTKSTETNPLKTPAPWAASTNKRGKVKDIQNGAIEEETDESPFIPVTVSKNKIQVKGRTLDVASLGLPENAFLIENLSPRTLAHFQQIHAITSTVLQVHRAKKQAK